MTREPEKNKPVTLDSCRQYVDENIFKLRPADYHKKYPNWPGAVGLEVEMLPVVFRDGQARPSLVALQGESNSLASCLRSLAARRGWTVETSPGEDGHGPLLMRVLTEQGDALTFEPGGQLEFSSHPYPCLVDATTRLEEIQKDLLEALASCKVELLQFGSNPWYSAAEVGLQMPKPRYRAMDRYFSEIGPWGEVMMRLTCSIQVCLDFGANEESMARRYLLAQLMSPFATAMFANSPFIAGRPSGVRSVRSKAWRHLDPSRSGVAQGLDRILRRPTKRSCTDYYTEFMFGAGVVFIESRGFQVLTKPTTFGQWVEHGIDGLYPTLQDLETHLSLLFPEVRPRGFLEMRSVDCLPQFWQTVPAAFYVGLLYDDLNIDTCHRLLNRYCGNIPALLEKSPEGLADDEIFSVSLKLLDAAIDGFSRMPSCFRSEISMARLIQYREHYTSRRRTPSDDWLDAVVSNEGVLSESVVAEVEDRWHLLFK